MRHTLTAAEPAPVRIDPDSLIPLSHFELDHPPPAEGWPAFLGRRAIVFRPDDLGRDSITRGDARRLLDQKRADELAAARLRQVAELEQEEQDRVRLAQVWKGVPADALPVGVSAGDAMAEAARSARPRRTTPLEDALDGQPMVYHSYQSGDES